MSLRQFLLSLVAALIATGALAANDQDVCAQRQGDKSIAACSRLISSGRLDGSQLTIIYALRGAAYRNKGDYDSAIADFTQTIELFQKDASNNVVADAYVVRANAYSLTGDSGNALADYHAALKLSPGNQQAADGILKLTPRNQQAVDTVRQPRATAVQKLPEDPTLDVPQPPPATWWRTNVLSRPFLASIVFFMLAIAMLLELKVRRNRQRRKTSTITSVTLLNLAGATIKTQTIIFVILATASALLSNYWYNLFGPFTYPFLTVPPLPGMFFGIVMGLAVHSLAARNIFESLAVAISIALVWVVAVNFAQLSIYPIDKALDFLEGPPTGTYRNFELALHGACGGFLGSLLTAFTIAISCKKFREFNKIVRTVIIGTLAGVLLECAGPPIAQQPIHTGTTLPLFLVWQAAIAASIVLGLGSRPKGPVPASKALT
jgi:tetratricopeptide (TPR) repeat protein